MASVRAVFHARADRPAGTAAVDLEKVRAALEGHGGTEILADGAVADAILAAFARPVDAAAFAVATQRALIARGDGSVRVGIDAGPAIDVADPRSAEVSTAQDISAAAHPGQTLLSESASKVIAPDLALGSVSDLGPHRLRNLGPPQRIFCLLHPELPEEVRPPRSLDVTPNNLPTYTTTFVGRTNELVSLEDRVLPAHPLTLVGPAGCGKTRLALQLAAVLSDRFSAGVWFVDLAVVTDADLVVSQVASAVGVAEPGVGTVLAALTTALVGRDMLIVLDNCEHVVSACADLIGHLATSNPGVAIIATSREPLHAQTEATHDVDPLSVPSTEDTSVDALREVDAVRLFVDRARFVRPSFDVDETNAAAVSDICSRLDGIPLAIELAAARVKLLTPRQICERLSDRFALLKDAGSTGRHATLLTALDWSHGLLSEDEAILYRRLAAFVGSFEPEAAEFVCGFGELEASEVLDLIGGLVDKSLLVVGEVGGRNRYRMLESVREHASKQLDASNEPDEVRNRHLDWFADLAARIGYPFAESDNAARVEADMSNVRVALGWGIAASAVEPVYLLASHMWQQWQALGHVAEAMQWIDRALDVPSLTTLQRADLINGAADLAATFGHFDKAEDLFEECLALREELGDERSIARTLGDMGVVAERRGDFDRARALLERSLALRRPLGDAWGTVATLVNLGGLGALQGDLGPARRWLDEAVDLGRQVGAAGGANFLLAAALLNLASVETAEGDRTAALPHIRECGRILQEIGDRQNFLQVFDALVAVVDDPALGATLVGAAQRFRDEFGTAKPPSEQAEYDAVVSRLRSSLPSGTYEEAVAHGRSLSFEDAAALALGDASIGRVTAEEYARAEVPGATGAFRKDADYWTVTYDGRTARLPDARGLSYIQTLLLHPHREFHCLELARESAAGGTQSGEDDLSVGATDAGDLLDPAAAGAYRERVRDLQEALDEARSFGDEVRAARAQDEIEAIEAELSAAFGLRGRARKGADTAERARKAVTNRIKASIAKIAGAHPELGQHLRNAVRTGTFCSYTPDRATNWDA